MIDYPQLFPISQTMAMPAAIALGSNLGDSPRILRAAVEALGAIPNTQVVACSPWYETLPVGPPQPLYLNGCVLINTDLPPETLLGYLQAIENGWGRQRRQHWGARTLDLDIILYGQEILTTPTLTIPHPLFWERDFVLVPLADIAPQWQDPRDGQTVLYHRQQRGQPTIIRRLS